MNDNTEITQELLIRNGWIDVRGNQFYFDCIDENGVIRCIQIECIDQFYCVLTVKREPLGRFFKTIGELKAIASALYKVELTFND